MSQGIYTLRWGILGAGHISGVFVRDIILDPTTRGVKDVKHELVAVGSRDASKAKEWIIKNTGKNDHCAKAYGSYEEVVNDPDVDAVYIGVPHTGHYALTKLALNGGKHVLCEKPFTVNAMQAKDLISLARKKQLFLMEAMWTRFLPVANYISDLVKGGELGDIRMLHADLSGDFDVENIPPTHRILDPNLGGGALLDLGPYPLVWAVIALYEHPSNSRKGPSSITGSMLKTPRTGVDAHTTWVLNFNDLNAQAVLTCGITLSSPSVALAIRLRKGNILVDAPIYRPDKVRVQWLKEEGGKEVLKEEVKTFINGSLEGQSEGGGWHYQADEVARCIRDGKLQSETWGMDKALLAMEIFDEVRKQGGLVYPGSVEQMS